MAILNIFEESTVQSNVERLEKLSHETQPKWGKMNSAQMLAHLNASYAVTYGDLKAKNGVFMKFMLKTFVKNSVVNEKPYKRNLRTAPYFLIADKRDFQKEKNRLMSYMKTTQELGSQHFEGKISNAFGPLGSREWNNLFQKHMDHHFSQFGI